MILYILLFITGFCEETVAILYYKMAQKNYKVYCSFLSMLRVFLWAFVIQSIFKHLDNSLFIILTYAFGGAIGDYFSLSIEPLLEKRIAKLKRKRGRRKKRWFLIGKRKK
jgi:uncharacterized protein YebE (UPF0316 family)